MTAPHLVALDSDHPGFADHDYRARRDAIARCALAYHAAGARGPIPAAAYTPAEHEVWREVWAELAPRHEALAAVELLELNRRFAIPRDHIPQLGTLSARLTPLTGFRMIPVDGLVPPRRFFAALHDGTFLATQYVRHSSRPLYTPEPDVIHELIGHAATLAHRGLAALNRRFGLVAKLGDRHTCTRLERVYWFTLEFGLVEQRGGVRAVGAGLLSSFGELERAQTRAELLDWDLERIAATEYSTSSYQERLFVAPSFQRMLDDLDAWLRAELRIHA